MTNTIRKNHLKYLGEVESISDVSSKLKQSGDAVLVFRGSPRLLVIKCPCGCGDEIKINLDKRTGPAWKIYCHDSITVYPSVWRDNGCKSHFIIWKNNICWCGGKKWWSNSRPSHKILRNTIVEIIRRRPKSHFEEIAEILKEDPWTVYIRCEELVNDHVIVEVDDGVFVIKTGISGTQY